MPAKSVGLSDLTKELSQKLSAEPVNELLIDFAMPLIILTKNNLSVMNV